MSRSRKLAVSLEHRFYRCGDSVYTKLSFPYKYWEDYLSYFDEVKVIARVQEITLVTDEYKKASGPNVEFFDIPYYLGPKQLVKKLPAVLLCAHKAAQSYDHFLLRSGNVSNFLWLFIMLYRKSYLREFPGNIKEGVEGVAGKNIALRLLAKFLDSFARLQGKYAKANSFVSKYCAELYGSARPGFVFSSFQPNEILSRKTCYDIVDKASIVSVGRLEGEKGHVDLVEAVSTLAERGLSIKLHIIGDGRQKENLEKAAIERDLDCIFHGAVSDRIFLFDLVKNADIFVIPSHTEGMPRALLEAMAIGLPCIGTAVGGIPEVLSYKALVAPGSPEDLANKIAEFISSARIRQEQADHNTDVIASRFGRDVTARKKLEFWSSVYE